MILALPTLYDLAQRCAPAVAPETLLAVVRAESGFDPLVVAVNSTPRRVYHPRSTEAAAALAQRLISGGDSVDLGLGQINSRNLSRLNLSIGDALTPCANLAASARVLQEGYLRAAPEPGAEQRALHTALSLYNTGDPNRGFQNGYVARIVRAAGRIVPAIKTPALSARAAGPTPSAASAAPAPKTWDVFARPSAIPLSVF